MSEFILSCKKSQKLLTRWKRI